MKKNLMMLILVFVGHILCNAQRITIVSCNKNVTDTTWQVAPRYDINDNPCSIIKVRTSDISGPLEFKGNIVEPVVSDNSTYTVYVLDGTKRLRILHKDYIPEIVDFTDYNESKSGVEGSMVYDVMVKGNTPTKISNSAIIGDLCVLAFSFNEEVKSLTVNSAEWSVLKQYGNEFSARRTLPYGEYKYEAISTEGRHKKGIVTLDSSVFGVKTVKIVFD